MTGGPRCALPAAAEEGLFQNSSPALPASLPAHLYAGRSEPQKVSEMGSGAEPAWRLLILLCGFSGVSCMEIQADSRVYGIEGQHVKLRCNFWSSLPISGQLTVDWTYRPEQGGPIQNIFHYQSTEAYPILSGIFGNRITWEGKVDSNDASIIIKDLTLNDNGTFICTVKNPPDVQGNLPLTVLTVTKQAVSFQLTTATLLSIVVFAPSALVVLLLLLRMQRKRKRSSKKYSIEVINEANWKKKKRTCKERTYDCCVRCIEDSDEEYENFEKSASNMTIVRKVSCN
ncbi:myelin protein zero-like protein 3 [Rhinatrema bivittatum]|uniref:myelin protein zero-like protein 3 n=1 Tax=Rhinatrema bivittatum TaxID=194408 RepID=UPI00112E9054|nr:myelin protein zero-like protein 3 [Rhinatrema bivittatum]